MMSNKLIMLALYSLTLLASSYCMHFFNIYVHFYNFPVLLQFSFTAALIAEIVLSAHIFCSHCSSGFLKDGMYVNSVSHVP